MDTKVCENLCQSVDKNIVGHEFGHAMGLEDIYYSVANNPTNYPSGITNKVDSTLCEMDWPGSADYLSDDSHSVLIMKLLMHGGGDGDGMDIPLGKVFGIKRTDVKNVYTTGWVRVGLEDMNRTPTSGGGQTQ